jgi:hypothetical protein
MSRHDPSWPGRVTCLARVRRIGCAESRAGARSMTPRRPPSSALARGARIGRRDGTRGTQIGHRVAGVGVWKERHFPDAPAPIESHVCGRRIRTSRRRRPTREYGASRTRSARPSRAFSGARYRTSAANSWSAGYRRLSDVLLAPEPRGSGRVVPDARKIAQDRGGPAPIGCPASPPDALSRTRLSRVVMDTAARRGRVRARSPLPAMTEGRCVRAASIPSSRAPRAGGAASGRSAPR